MSTLADRMQRDERLHRLWQLLDNQRKLVATLHEAEDSCYPDDSWLEAAMTLRRKMAYELYLTCTRIWDESAKDGVVGLNV